MGDTNNTLAAIRERLQQAEQKKTGYDNALYPFWNAKNDTTSVIRLLPDGNPNNTFFWVEKLQIKLPFNGIKNGDAKIVYVSVPCVEMFPREEYPSGCPILTEVRQWFKDTSLEEKAKKYWKKPSYIMQGFVRESALTDEEVPENPIRRFAYNKQIFNNIKAGLMDPEMINVPTDYAHGTDFRIKKTAKGQYADYGTSSYARSESALTSVELEAIEKYHLNNLSDFLGKKPSADDMKVIKEMFEASVNGEEYDPEKWGNYYRPAGFKSDKDTEFNTTEMNNSHSEKKEESKSESKSVTEKESSISATNSAADILAMIRARSAKKTENK